jgi:uncharacterized membrane protein
MVTYQFLLFLHVLAAMVWVGAAVVMTVVRVRAARESGLEADGLALQLNELVTPPPWCTPLPISSPESP